MSRYIHLLAMLVFPSACGTHTKSQGWALRAGTTYCRWWWKKHSGCSQGGDSFLKKRDLNSAFPRKIVEHHDETIAI